jgi:hypothetical protein
MERSRGRRWPELHSHVRSDLQVAEAAEAKPPL